MKPLVLAGLALVALATVPSVTWAQVVDPTSILIDESDPTYSPVCADGSAGGPTCITLPPDAILDRVDVFFLFDDTGSFAGFVPTVSDIFSDLVTDLGLALPSVEFGFGVGRFEDYGGPGTGFSGEFVAGRPFLLNQPIVTEADAGGAVALETLINDALARTAPGFGGDGPESAVAEGLYQVATGLGFDGDGDGLTTGIGGVQVAGAVATQTTPDVSGDVPAFASNVATASGNIGGAGFRTGALRLVILATDICSISAFDAALGVPPTIDGTGGSEPVEEFACSSTAPGTSRFGFVSDSLSSGGNTIAGAVVPSGAGTVPDTIAALNAAGIRVLGMGPGAGPTPSGSGPSSSEDVFLSALARLTGAVDEFDNPLVFDIGAGGDPLKDAIVAAIEATATAPIDITLMTSGDLPDGLTVDIDPDTVFGVGPDEQACFDVTFTGSGAPSGMFDLEFETDGSGTLLGTIPVLATCNQMITVALDIKPTSCPNPIDCRSMGNLPVAIVGTDSFDVTQVDPASVRLAGVAPIRWAYEDVTTPYQPLTGKTGCRDCTTDGPDGILDMTFKFKSKDISNLMSGFEDRSCVLLDLTGNLLPEYGGTPIYGEDVVRFQCR